MKNFKSYALAGFFIAIGAGINVAMIAKGNPILGAFLFTVGLYAVVMLQMDLYTGKVGNLFIDRKFSKAGAMIVVNLIAAWVTGLVLRSVLTLDPAFFTAKLALTPIQVLVKAFMCGVLMYLAVNLDKERRTGVFICIPTFILCGYEHCVANAAYYGLSGIPFSMDVLVFFVLNVIGNTLGHFFLALCFKPAK